MSQAYTLTAVSHNITTCDCCGRENLKKTVLLAKGNIGAGYFGTGCAAKIMQVQEIVVKTEVAAIEKAAKKAALEAERAANIAAAWERRQALLARRANTVASTPAKGFGQYH